MIIWRLYKQSFSHVLRCAGILPKEEMAAGSIGMSEIYNTTVHACCIIEKIKVCFYHLNETGIPYFEIAIK